MEVNSSPPGWSSWTNCAEMETCFRTRTFTCDAGEGIECLTKTDSGNFRQDAYNCIESSECLENVEEKFDAPEVSVLETHPLSLVIELNSPTLSHTRVSSTCRMQHGCPTTRSHNFKISSQQNEILEFSSLLLFYPVSLFILYSN